MSQITNPVKNPSCETNTTGWYTIPGTTGVAALSNPSSGTAAPGAGVRYARATWSTASTAVGGGMKIGHATSSNVERIDVSASTQYTVGVWVRPSKAKTMQLQALVYNNSGVQVGTTTLGTAVAVTANAWTQIVVTFTSGVGGVRLVLQAVDTDATRWSIGNTLDADAAIVWPGATVQEYSDPSTNPMMGWSAAVHASTSTLFTPTVALTQYSDETPCPRVEVLVLDLPPGFITIRRFSDARIFDVRGAIMVPSASGVTVLDTEVPEGITATYQAELFDPNQNSIGFSVTAVTTMPVTGVWISQPLDPTLAVRVDLDDSSAASIRRGFDGEVVYTDGATLGRWVGGRRRGVTGLQLDVETSTLAAANRLQEIFGTYDVDQVPVVCIRTPPGFARIPRTLFLAVPDPDERDVSTRFDGELVAFTLIGDEVLPPTPGLATALLTYDDVDLFYGSYAAIDAAYGSYLARDRDYAKAGYAS